MVSKFSPALIQKIRDVERRPSGMSDRKLSEVGYVFISLASCGTLIPRRRFDGPSGKIMGTRRR
jgi:hypothetical protein